MEASKLDVILEQVKRERECQDEKWGEQNHKGIEWIAILTEEVGEAAKEAVDYHFKNPYVNAANMKIYPDQGIQNARKARYRKELVQVAAVAVAMIESLDRNGE